MHLLNIMYELIENIKTVDPEITKLCLPTNSGFIFLFPKEIIYIQSFNAYAYLYAVSGEKIFINKSLKEMESLLNEDAFFRVHKSFIVNLQKIKRYVRNGADHLIMENGEKLPISRKKKKDLLDLLLSNKNKII